MTGGGQILNCDLWRVICDDGRRRDKEIRAMTRRRSDGKLVSLDRSCTITSGL